jgi:hypothetical protein
MTDLSILKKYEQIIAIHYPSKELSEHEGRSLRNIMKENINPDYFREGEIAIIVEAIAGYTELPCIEDIFVSNTARRAWLSSLPRELHQKIEGANRLQRKMATNFLDVMVYFLEEYCELFIHEHAYFSERFSDKNYTPLPTQEKIALTEELAIFAKKLVAEMSHVQTF